MSNKLIKDTITVNTTREVVIPGYTIPTTFIEYHWVGPSVPPPANAVSQLIGGKEYPIGSGGVSVFASAIKVAVVTSGSIVIPPRTVTVPATVESLNVGWNAGALSIKSLQTDLVFSFKAPRSLTGAIVGLAFYSPYRMNPSIGFNLYGGNVSSRDNGSVDHDLRVAYAEGATFTIVRHGDTIFMTVSELLDGTLNYLLYYSSPHNEALDPGAGTPNDRTIFVGHTGLYVPPYNYLYADAALYTAGDYIYDPVLRPVVAADLVMRPMAMNAGRAVVDVAMNLLPLRMVSGAVDKSPLTMLPLTMMASNYPVGGVALRMAPMEMYSYATDFLVASGSNMSMEPLTFVGFSYVGSGGATMTMKRLAMLAADHPYGEAKLAMEYPMVFARSDPMGTGSMIQVVNIPPTMIGSVLIAALMNESGVITDAMTFTTREETSIVSLLAVTPIFDAISADISAVMMSAINMLAGVPLADEDNQTWVMNLNTSASYSYEQYDFNSFARIGDSYYGARSDGVYLLEGDDDNGQPIRASMGFGKKNFGTLKQKRIEACYAAMSSTGVMVLKVIVDEGSPQAAEYLYTARGFKESLETQRFDTGRGIRANYLTFEIYNKDGCDFELEQLEFAIVDINRRL